MVIITEEIAIGLMAATIWEYFWKPGSLALLSVELALSQAQEID